MLRMLQRHIDEIKSLQLELTSSPQEYDFLPPAGVSHAKMYSADPVRLRRYARQVICARLMILIVFSRMNTMLLLDTYVRGLNSWNPFPLLLSARSQLELLSVVADVIAITKDNSGEHSDRFAERVRIVDEALITATYGTRSSVLKDLIPKVRPSRLRSITPGDLAILTSKNVLTRLDRLSKKGTYPECKRDYERLCEYVHPNYGMNMLLVVASPQSDKLARFSLNSREPFERALAASVEVMARAARQTIAVIDEVQPPFGTPEISYPR